MTIVPNPVHHQGHISLIQHHIPTSVELSHNRLNIPGIVPRRYPGRNRAAGKPPFRILATSTPSVTAGTAFTPVRRLVASHARHAQDAALQVFRGQAGRALPRSERARGLTVVERTASVLALSGITCRAQGLESRRELMADQPRIEPVSTTDFLHMLAAVTMDVIYTQVVQAAAAPAGLTVVGEHLGLLSCMFLRSGQHDGLPLSIAAAMSPRRISDWLT